MSPFINRLVCLSRKCQKSVKTVKKVVLGIVMAGQVHSKISTLCTIVCHQQKTSFFVLGSCHTCLEYRYRILNIGIGTGIGLMKNSGISCLSVLV